MNEHLKRHLEAYRNFVLAVAKFLGEQQEGEYSRQEEWSLSEYYKNVDITVPDDHKKDFPALFKGLETKLERQKRLFEEGIIDEETFKKKREHALKEKEILENERKNKDVLPKELVYRRAAELTYDFNYLWEHRWVAPLQYRKFIHTMIKEMRTDGKILDIDFYQFNLPDSLEHASVIIETPKKEKNKKQNP